MRRSGFCELTIGVGSTFGCSVELAAEDHGASFIKEVDICTGAAAINGTVDKAPSTCLRSKGWSSMAGPSKSIPNPQFRHCPTWH